MANILMLPIKPGALYVKETKQGVSPSFNFTKLPYTGAEGDINADTPFLSRSISDKPFARAHHPLEKGMHIHWMPSPLFRRSIDLPVITRKFINTVLTDSESLVFWNELIILERETDCLFKFKEDTLIVLKPLKLWGDDILSSISEQADREIIKGRLSGDTTDGLTFPAAPNCWTITRLRNSKVEKEWVLESDYIHEQEKVENLHRYSTFPWLKTNEEGAQLPYRCIGRVYEKDKKPAGKANYLSDSAYGPLTALGYGDLSFTSYYPNCKSVFGFYDEEITEDALLDKLEYRISGYYSDPKWDYWKQLMNYLSYEINEKAGSTEKNDYLQAWLKDNLQLFVDIDIEELAEEVVCHGRIEIVKVVKKSNEEVTVTIANSGTEAISAALANEMADEKKGKFPNDIEERCSAFNRRTKKHAKPLHKFFIKVFDF